MEFPKLRVFTVSFDAAGVPEMRATDRVVASAEAAARVLYEDRMALRLDGSDRPFPPLVAQQIDKARDRVIARKTAPAYQQAA